MATVIKRNKWEIWRDVIMALFLREIRTGFNDKFGLSWAVISPIVFISVLSFIRSIVQGGGETHTLPVFLFMALGILMIQSFLQTLSASAGAISKNKSLFAFRQVQPISAVIAAGLFQLFTKMFVICGVAVLMYFMEMELRVTFPILMITCLLLLWLFALSVGLIFGIIELFVVEVKKVRELLTRPLFFISGVFFSLQDFPKEYWHFLDWNPILHAIELTRYSTYSTYGDDGVSLGYLAFSVLCSVFLSCTIYFVLWKQAIGK